MAWMTKRMTSAQIILLFTAGFGVTETVTTFAAGFTAVGLGAIPHHLYTSSCVF